MEKLERRIAIFILLIVCILLYTCIFPPFVLQYLTKNIYEKIVIVLAGISIIIMCFDRIFSEEIGNKINIILIYLVYPIIVSEVIKVYGSKFKSDTFIGLIYCNLKKADINTNFYIFYIILHLVFAMLFVIILLLIGAAVLVMLDKKKTSMLKHTYYIIEFFTMFLIVILSVFILGIILANINHIVTSENIDIILFYYATVVFSAKIFIWLKKYMSYIFNKKNYSKIINFLISIFTYIIKFKRINKLKNNKK